MARLSREESRVLTRERLLASARKVFAERGIGAVTVDEIAEGADYSKGAFYSNFGSKEELFIELLRRHLAEELLALGQLAEAADTIERLLADLTRFYTAMELQPDACILALEFQMSAYRNAALIESFKALFEAHRQSLSLLLELCVQRAGMRLAQPGPEVITTLMGMTNGLLLQRLISPSYKPGSTPDMIVLYLRSVLLSAEPR